MKPQSTEYQSPNSFTTQLPFTGKFILFGLSNSCMLITCFFLFFSIQILLLPFSNYEIPLFGNDLPSCDPNIAPFYIYDLPQRFNGKILSDCHKMHPWTDMCPHVANHGFGQPASRPGWYSTNQHTLELIFHARASNHPCRTYDPKSARLFYIPFYLGYYTSSTFHAENHTVRDAMALDLTNYLSNISYFHFHGGNDHFIVGGRGVYEFYRSTDPKQLSYNPRWTRLLALPEFSNVSILVIERGTWDLTHTTQVGIPYPSYFHPTTHTEMTNWQDEVRRSKRNHLFTFIGAGREGNSTTARIRSELLRQCESSEQCIMINCHVNPRLCRGDADWIMAVMKRAHFCVQPRGDSWARRSVFDSVLAGCIPVFFSENTAYNQYPWYNPEKKEDWSVLIRPEKVDQTEKILAKIPMEQVERMREVVIAMIPHVTYVDPSATQIGFHDAVDVALIEMTKRVDRILNVSV